MAGARLRLHHRIVLPFAAVAILATGVTAYVALAVTSRVMQARVDSQLAGAADVLGRSDLAFNPAVIRSARDIMRADVVTFTATGTVLATTLDAPLTAQIVSALAREAAPTQVRLARESVCGRPCTVAYRAVATRPDTRIAVIVVTDDLAGARRTVTTAIVEAALASVVLMILISELMTRRITRPLADLVTFTQRVSDEHSPERAPAGADEVGELGAAFNDMLDRLEKSREALVRTEKLALAGLFAARVAHDIRNPLSSIKMQTQLLRARLSRSSDDATIASLEAVQRDILQVESVVRDLLELARPGELRLQPVSLNDVVDAALEQLAPHLAYRHVDVRRSWSELPPVALDVDRFRQALLNVVNNASDAMPTGGVLTLSTSRANGFVVLHVCDDGAGVPQELLPRVFDPFVSSKDGGVGLGLVNAKAVVESHGGTITLAPADPRGTVVTITLPITHN